MTKKIKKIKVPNKTLYKMQKNKFQEYKICLKASKIEIQTKTFKDVNYDVDKTEENCIKFLTGNKTL